MCAICLSGTNRSCCGARGSSRLTLFRKCTCVLRIFFNAEAIIASSMSKPGQFCPVIDRDLIRSLRAFAISTSLIQSMVIWGSAVFWLTSALVFQLWNSVESGNVPRFHSTIEIVGSKQVPAVWDSIPLLLWKWGATVDVFNESLLIPSLCLDVSIVSGLDSWEEDAKFFELLKIVEDSPSWAGDRSKTSPIILVQFCVFRGNPESQRGKVLELRIVEVWSGTWVAWFRITKFFCIRQGILLCFVIPESEPSLDSQS